MADISRRMSMHSLSSRTDSMHEKELKEHLHDTNLLHTQANFVEKKDFSKEVRGTRDINNFLQKSEVLLDLAETELDPIVDSLLHMMLKPKPFASYVEESITADEIKGLVFSNSSKTILSNLIQGTLSSSDSHYDFEQTWLCASIPVPTLKKRYVGIARLKQSVNLGKHAEEVRFFTLILCPVNVKPTKSALETGRTFATLFSDQGLRHELLMAQTAYDFKECIRKATTLFAKHQMPELEKGMENGDKKEAAELKWYQMGKGIMNDLRGRIPYYLDDFKDGIVGKNTIQKTTSTTLFLYFSVILPAVALGVLNAANTDGQISVPQVIVGQTIGALIFALFAGQPLVVVMTTAPLALFIKIIYSISIDFKFDFLPFYAMVGVWNTVFLFFYSAFNMSILMKYSSRSTEEIFSNFITIAFILDSTKNMIKNFKQHYWSPYCSKDGFAVMPEDGTLAHPLAGALNGTNGTNGTMDSMGDALQECHPEVSFLSLILMLGTVWLGVTLFDFKKTPFLNKAKREILSDYALPVAVIVFSIIGSICFQDVKVQTFTYNPNASVFNLVDFSNLGFDAIILSGMLGFSLSLLFFMDQNISAAMVNNPENKLQKGNAYHWDLLLIAAINGTLCLFGLPFMHAVLPHSPLHVKCLADTEAQVENGYVRDIVVLVRETRLTNLFSNILIGLSIFVLPIVLDYIPTAVLDGLFLYLAVTALYGNQFFERILLLFTEQSAYPPNHYIRRVPQRKMHTFTGFQVLQLIVLCVFGFFPWPYSKMIFPIVILVFLPVRHVLIPMFIEKKYLEVLDGH